MNTQVMITVGLGEGSTIVLGIIADGNVVCNVVLDHASAAQHIHIMQRHIDALRMMPTEQSAAIN